MTDPAKPLLVNIADVPWEDFGSEGRFGSTDRVLAHHLACERLDTAVTRLMPGMVSCPYHFHHINEELFIVLEGHGQVRLNGETHRLKPHDVISCPPGPAGAHQIINDTDQPLVYLAISTEDPHEICEYPDSGKVMAFVKRGERRHRYIHRLADAVPYMDGETP